MKCPDCGEIKGLRGHKCSTETKTMKITIGIVFVVKPHIYEDIRARTSTFCARLEETYGVRDVQIISPLQEI